MNEFRCWTAERQMFCPRCKGVGAVCTQKKRTDLHAEYGTCPLCNGAKMVAVQELRWARGRANAQAR